MSVTGDKSPDFFRCLTPEEIKTVNKKQVQDFVREMIFGKTHDNINDIINSRYAGIPVFTAAVIRTLYDNGSKADFAKIKAMSDFALEGREVKARKK